MSAPSLQETANSWVRVTIYWAPTFFRIRAAAEVYEIRKTYPPSAKRTASPIRTRVVDWRTNYLHDRHTRFPYVGRLDSIGIGSTSQVSRVDNYLIELINPFFGAGGQEAEAFKLWTREGTLIATAQLHEGRYHIDDEIADDTILYLDWQDALADAGRMARSEIDHLSQMETFE